MTATYEYMNEAGIDPELICSICHSPFDNPHCTPCGETFCHACVTNWLTLPNDTCPLCRRPLTLNVLRPASHLVRNMLDRLRVRCSACGQIDLERGHFSEHRLRACHIRNRSHSNNPSNRANVNRPVSGQPGRDDSNTSSNTLRTFILSFVFFGILFYFFDSHSPTTFSYKVAPTDVLENEIKSIPTSCSSIQHCPSSNVPFVDSNVLTTEHQHYLNFFYSKTKSSIAKWELIYRGSTDGFDAGAFHTRCDNKDETFVILSSTNGFLFGGYTDVSWTTPQLGYPTYSRSTRAFLFSLDTPEKLPATKFFLNARYHNYAIVNDFLSGPVFGNMMRPDLGIYQSNGEFRCQINFPLLYKSGIGIPYFPTSDDCIIDEIEVFVPSIEVSSSFLTRMPRMTLTLCISCIQVFVFTAMVESYNHNAPFVARVLSVICLILLRISSSYGALQLIGLFFVVILVLLWNEPIAHGDSNEIQFEKRLIMLSFVSLLSCIIFFPK